MKVLQIGPSCKSKLDDNLKDQRWREWFSGCIAVMLSCQYVFLDWLGGGDLLSDHDSSCRSAEPDFPIQSHV